MSKTTEAGTPVEPTEKTQGKTLRQPTVEVKSQVAELRSYGSTEIKIKPYVDLERPSTNMGLERYGQVLFEGAAHDQQLRCTEINGTVRYMTGLDEYARSVKDLPEKEREAKIKSIRSTIAEMEQELWGTKIDVNDDNFWAKTNLAPNKPDFWSTVKLTIGNDGVTLDPKNARDLLIIIAAEANGFDDVAASYEEAKNSASPPKFYVERRRDARVEAARQKEVVDEAIFELYRIKSEEPQKLFWLAKNLLPIANQYKPKDPVGIWYGDLREFITGEGIEKNKKMAPKKFMDALKRPQETSQVRGYVLEAAFVKLLITKSDNRIYHRYTDTMLGGNLEEVVQFLKEPLNQEILETIQKDIENIWHR